MASTTETSHGTQQSQTASSYLLPSQEQVLLAAKLVQSMPHGISFAEHAATLLKVVTPGPLQFSSKIRHIDTAEYWKGQYTHLLDKNKELENRISILEQKLVQISSQDSLEDLSQPTIKASVGSNEGYSISRCLGSRSRKRKKIIEFGDDLIPPVEEESSLRSLPSDAPQNLNKHVYKLAQYRLKLMSLPPKPTTVTEIELSTNTISTVLSVIGSTLETSCVAVRLLKDSRIDKRVVVFEKITNRIVQLFLSCFHAFDNVCKTILGREKKGLIIYEMSMFFGKALDLLHNLCFAQTSHSMMSTSHSESSINGHLEEVEYAANKQLGRMLATIFRNLDWQAKQPMHGELLEGLLYTVINRVGRLLSQSIFGECVVDSTSPGHITEISVDQASLLKCGLYKHETRYVIQVLHNALGEGERKESLLNVLATARLRSTTQESAAHPNRVPAPMANLLTSAKEVLKRSLQHCAFGSSKSDDVLKFPLLPSDESCLSLKDGALLYDNNWFGEKVWNLIGWDLVV